MRFGIRFRSYKHLQSGGGITLQGSPPATEMTTLISGARAPRPPLLSFGGQQSYTPLVGVCIPCSFLLPSLSYSLPGFAVRRIAASSSGGTSFTADIEMVRGRDGSWSAREQKVVVLWDLDNKPPRGQPYDAAVALRRVAELFGHVVEVSAYANHHAFLHLPEWVIKDRRERRRLDALERKGLVVPDEPYVCGVCGRKCRTKPDLKRHFVQLHERERQKKLARMQSLKGKKREKYKQKFISGNHKYTGAARELLTPKSGYGLASELRRAGVSVKKVQDKPQAADLAVKRQMRHSMSRGIDCLFLVSDDSDFSDMVRKAKDASLRTVVIGDGRRALGRLAHFWVPWSRVENGEVDEEVLLSGRNNRFDREHGGDDEDEFYSSASFYDTDEEEDNDDDYHDFGDFYHLVDETVVESTVFGNFEVTGYLEEDFCGWENIRGAGDGFSWANEYGEDYFI